MSDLPAPPPRPKPKPFMDDVDAIKARIEELKRERDTMLNTPAKDD